MSRWVEDPRFAGSEWFVQHLDGVKDFEAPAPRRWHRCRAQTRGIVGGLLFERCACGALRHAYDAGRGIDGVRPWTRWMHKRQRVAGKP